MLTPRERERYDRQIMMGEIGQEGQENIGALNSAVEIEAITETIGEGNASQLLDGYDVIVDAMDNLPTRYILNPYAVRKNPVFSRRSESF
jgi:molybdopterin/thiamine biosynthesis adenylyltransferase